MKNVNIQPSSGYSHGETGMKITPITQHRQGGNTEDREEKGRAVNERAREMDTTFKKLAIKNTEGRERGRGGKIDLKI